MSELNRLCQCTTVTTVARDGFSTCGQCGGMDAYKKSPRRKEEIEHYSGVEIILNVDGKKIAKEFTVEEAGNQIVELIKTIANDRNRIEALEAGLCKIANGYDDEEEGSAYYYPAYKIAMELI